MVYKNRRNPILPLSVHVPDPEAHVMPDGKLYIYGSYDLFDMTYCSQEYHVISTPDMEHWTVHGTSFTAQDVPWMGTPAAKQYPGIDWEHPTPFLKKMMEEKFVQGASTGGETENAGDGGAAADSDGQQEFTLPDGITEEELAQWMSQEMLFAPDCICRDGKYYLYFCMSGDSEGVAVSDSPTGPFLDAVQLPCGGIDPAVFIDDDGQAYYYWGQVYAHGVKLHADMRTFDADAVVCDIVTEGEHCFHEGSSMRKIGDTYYYVFADMERGKPTALGYATSKSPLGPFTYRGIIIDNDGCDPKSWNNHGSIECVNGKWYVFYHRCSRSTEWYRRLCIEPITILPDGSIPEVKMTSQGIGAPFAPGERIFGYQACGLKGTCYIDADKEHGYEEKLTGISAGDKAVFRYVKSDEPWTGIRLTTGGSGEITVLFDGQSAGRVTIYGEKGKLQTVSTGIEMPQGEYELTLRFEKTEELELMEVTLLS